MKLLALTVAVVMLAVPFASMLDDTDNSDAAGSAGTFNVYVNTGSGWSGENVSGYNALLALENTTYYTDTNYTHSIDESYTYTYQYDGVTYTDINSSYGTITTLGGYTNGISNTWNVLVYIDDEWVDGSDAIGWYKPFVDYESLLSNYGTANIALWYGSGSSNTAITTLETYTTNTLSEVSLTSISTSTGSVFEHIFYIKNSTATTLTISGTFKTYDPSTSTYSTGVTLTNSNITSGVYIVGYGSDAELALKNALGSNAVFYSSTSPVPGYLGYGWISTIFGVGTVQTSGADTPNDYTDDHYTYWSTYTTYNTDWAGYVVGAYSALTNAPLVDGTLALAYESS